LRSSGKNILRQYRYIGKKFKKGKEKNIKRIKKTSPEYSSLAKIKT
jgi:hypothetical protein